MADDHGLYGGSEGEVAGGVMSDDGACEAVVVVLPVSPAGPTAEEVKFE
jgi:hypothetical protein